MEFYRNFVKVFQYGYISVQKFADSQAGTNHTPFALQSFRCRIIKLIQETGGQCQLPSSIQLTVKALTSNVPGQ